MPAPYHAALLRGINVGGNNKLPMKDLAALFERAGCSEVVTYIQSGNVVFRAAPGLAARIPELIPAAIHQRFKLTVPVVVRSAAALRKIAAKHPHAAPEAEAKRLHVAFLARKPTAAQAASLDPQRSPADVFTLVGSELYVLYADVAKSKLTNQYLDARLGTVSTMRNWNTVQKLVELTTDPGER
jgi:uncharacterized protein (DUF1697 family)